MLLKNKKEKASEEQGDQTEDRRFDLFGALDLRVIVFCS
jgi:hypothetical protein